VTSNSTPVIRVPLIAGIGSEPGYLHVIVVGHASWIAEVVEILGWIGSALRSSATPDDIQFCTPHVEHDAPKPGSQGLACQISYTTETPTGDQISVNGNCWHGLFSAPAIAKGYPVVRRPMGMPGLDISLSMMSALVSTPRLNCFGGKYFIKGFSTVLVPTHYENNMMM
jgi:hypothetical protein